MPDALYFTESADANELIAREPLALLIGFALDQQVSVQKAFAGPLALQRRLGTLDAAAIAGTDPDRLQEAFRERPAIHRFPGAMANRIRDLCAFVASEHGGRAERIWEQARDADDLRHRLRALPGFGPMKVTALGAVLAKRFEVAVAQELVPGHPTLGDVDSPQALADFQEAKRAYKAQLRAAGG